MTKIAIPQSWRDLSYVELVALLTQRPQFFSLRDLLWARHQVAQARAADMRDAEQSAWKAELEAFHAWSKKRDSKTLAAYERAQKTYRRDAAAMKRAEALEEQLWKLCTAEAEA
ncbi:hypothetical protein [Bosea vestrisii]|uniref:Uncharacterized protein n=1 Tax=Bosea vestrisii TaxID=151416 RepID=A0ABW0H7M2_9HYPH